MQRHSLYAVIGATVAPPVTLLIACLIIPSAWHMFAAIGTIIWASIGGGVIMYFTHRERRSAEERGAHDAMDTVIREASALASERQR